MKMIILMLSALLLHAPLSAKEARPMAADPVIEARVMALSEELRCLVCQNQTLAGSDSDFAKDIRREMRGMMKQGKTDEQVLAFLVERFGDFILFKPPMKSNTWLLWFGPLLLLVFGATVLMLVLRRRQTVSEKRPLSTADHQRAESLLGGVDDPRETEASDNRTEEGKA